MTAGVEASLEVASPNEAV